MLACLGLSQVLIAAEPVPWPQACTVSPVPWPASAHPWGQGRSDGPGGCARHGDGMLLQLGGQGGVQMCMLQVWPSWVRNFEPCRPRTSPVSRICQSACVWAGHDPQRSLTLNCPQGQEAAPCDDAHTLHPAKVCVPCGSSTFSQDRGPLSGPSHACAMSRPGWAHQLCQLPAVMVGPCSSTPSPAPFPDPCPQPLLMQCKPPTPHTDTHKASLIHKSHSCLSAPYPHAMQCILAPISPHTLTHKAALTVRVSQQGSASAHDAGVGGGHHEGGRIASRNCLPMSAAAYRPVRPLLAPRGVQVVGVLCFLQLQHIRMVRSVSKVVEDIGRAVSEGIRSFVTPFRAQIMAQAKLAFSGGGGGGRRGDRGDRGMLAGQGR